MYLISSLLLSIEQNSGLRYIGNKTKMSVEIYRYHKLVKNQLQFYYFKVRCVSWNKLYTGQQNKWNDVKAPNNFSPNLRALNMKITLLFLGSLPFLLYRKASLKKQKTKKKQCFHLFYVYVILTDDNISQSKIVETSQFVFKPINIGLLIDKYYFFKSLRITRPKPTRIFIKINKYFHQII